MATVIFVTEDKHSTTFLIGTQGERERGEREVEKSARERQRERERET